MDTHPARFAPFLAPQAPTYHRKPPSAPSRHMRRFGGCPFLAVVLGPPVDTQLAHSLPIAYGHSSRPIHPLPGSTGPDVPPQADICPIWAHAPSPRFPSRHRRPWAVNRKGFCSAYPPHPLQPLLVLLPPLLPLVHSQNKPHRHLRLPLLLCGQPQRRRQASNLASFTGTRPKRDNNNKVCTMDLQKTKQKYSPWTTASCIR